MYLSGWELIWAMPEGFLRHGGSTGDHGHDSQAPCEFVLEPTFCKLQTSLKASGGTFGTVFDPSPYRERHDLHMPKTGIKLKKQFMFKT